MLRLAGASETSERREGGGGHLGVMECGRKAPLGSTPCITRLRSDCICAQRRDKRKIWGGERYASSMKEEETGRNLWEEKFGV